MAVWIIGGLVVLAAVLAIFYWMAEPNVVDEEVLEEVEKESVSERKAVIDEEEAGFEEQRKQDIEDGYSNQ